MKKILTLALAAFMASAVSAQSLSTKLSGKPQSKRALPTMATQRVNLPAPKIADDSKAFRTVAGYSNNKFAKAVAQQKKCTYSPVLQGIAAAPRKELSMLEKYVGYGIKYGDNKKVKWSMVPGTLEDSLGVKKADVLWDIIPVPDFVANAGITNIPVEYTYDEEEKTITVPAQRVLTRSYADGSESYILVFSELEDDGSIIINVGDDGNLEVNENDVITYGDWDTPNIEYDDDDNWVGYNGYYIRMQRVQYFTPGEEPFDVPQPEYEPEGLFLHASINPQLQSYSINLQFMPAYATQSFKNFTTDEADAWAWTVKRLQWNPELGDNGDYEEAETITADTKDFSINTVDAVYTSPELVASLEGHASDPYIWGRSHDSNELFTDTRIYAGFLGENFEDVIISKCDLSNLITTYKSMATPDINSRKDTLTSIILYQGKPETPFYFEGVNFLVEYLQFNEDFTLKCKIQKVTKDPETQKLTLGDVIAEADAKAEDIIQGYNGGDWDLWQLNWTEFYTVDEYGFSETLDYLMIEDEFAIVFEGWDNGTFSCAPTGESNENANGTNSIYCQVANDDNIYRYSWFSHLFAGFNGAIYGYLHTEDPTSFQFGKEGGAGIMHVYPMLYSSSTDEETGETVPSIRLFIESITIDGEPLDYEVDEETGEDNLPEWLTYGIIDPSSLSENEETEETESDGIDYYLGVGVKALTDAESHNVEIVFWQEGARLKVTINQTADGEQPLEGDVNGDGTVDVADISAVISQMAGSAEYATADVNGDGAVDVADISAIITIMAAS
ncbi:MAG: dockerin type I repeat-containing protein [Prevotella sp.]|nr:dockerin type I repeat-containing protein [Prevotella sp.]